MHGPYAFNWAIASFRLQLIEWTISSHFDLPAVGDPTPLKRMKSSSINQVHAVQNGPMLYNQAIDGIKNSSI